MYLIPLVVFSIVAILFVLVPYFRSRDLNVETAPDIAVYRAQLAELENDLKRRLIDEEDAKRARTEIERRILNAAEHEKNQVAHENPSNVIAVILVVVLLLATGIYALLGTPSMPDYPKKDVEKLIATEDGLEERQKILDLRSQLLSTLANRPPDARGLVYLSTLEMNLGNYGAATEALYQAHRLAPDTFEVQLRYAEMLIVIAGDQVTPAAKVILNKAAKLDSNHPALRYYFALADYQAGDIELALEQWSSISGALAGDDPLKPLVDFWAERAASDLGMAQSLPETRAPSITAEQAETIQSMDEEGREALIGQMVLQLADKQQENPSNIEGWLRLSQAYMVLGDKEKAIDAMKQAVENAPQEQKEILQKEVEKLVNLR